MDKKQIITAVTMIGILVLLGLGFFTYNFYQSKQVLKDTTLMGAAVQSINADECEGITTQAEFVSKDSCYNYIAQETNQRSLCDKIGQKELKDNCYENTK